MTKLIAGGMLAAVLATAGCMSPSPPPSPPLSASRVQVLSLESEYAQQFLAPATSWSLGPKATADGITKLQGANADAWGALSAADKFTSAAPQADATAPIAQARSKLDQAEAVLKEVVP